MSMRSRGRRFPISALLTAILMALSLTMSTGDPAAGSDAQAAAATFTDDFNGPAGSAVDGSKWQHETGDNVNNHELQW
ncbi:MAG: hypothetical protein ACRDOO_06375 [Actinomadura sp.]